MERHTPVTRDVEEHGEVGQLMAEYGITQEPGPYVYGGYHYDKLPDAVQYAQRQLPSGTGPRAPDGPESREAGQLMAEYGITQEPGPYVYGGYHYDKLPDAVQYAQRQQV